MHKIIHLDDTTGIGRRVIYCRTQHCCNFQMKTNICLILALVLWLVLPVHQASAAFTLIDNLKNHSAVNLAGQTANGPSGGVWQGLGTAGSIVIGPSVATGTN